jgi:hypothetical protein
MEIELYLYSSILLFKFESRFKNEKVVYKISQISDDYYVYDGYFDKITNPLIITDTIWAKEKVKYSNTQLFKQIIDYSEVNNFTDTSKFSLLYIYRPGKLKNLLDNYFIYFDDILMCYAQNNSGYIFKIYKEGSYNIKSKLFTYESSININLKFGNVYFVKSMIHWGLFNHFFNIKFEMIEMQNDLGRAEYEKIRKK